MKKYSKGWLLLTAIVAIAAAAAATGGLAVAGSTDAPASAKGSVRRTGSSRATISRWRARSRSI